MDWWEAYANGTETLHDAAPGDLSVGAIGPDRVREAPTWVRRLDRPATPSEIATLALAEAIVPVASANEVLHLLWRGRLVLTDGRSAWLYPLAALGPEDRGLRTEGLARFVDAVARGSGIDEALARSPWFWATEGPPGRLGSHLGRPDPSWSSSVEAQGQANYRASRRRAIVDFRVDAELLIECTLAGAALNVLRPIYRCGATRERWERDLTVAEAALVLAEANPPISEAVPLLRRCLEWTEGNPVPDRHELVRSIDAFALTALSAAYVIVDWLALETRDQTDALGALTSVNEAWAGMAWLPIPAPDEAWRFAGRIGSGAPWWVDPSRVVDGLDLLWFGWLLDAWAHRSARHLVGVHHDEDGLVAYELSQVDRS